MCRPHAGSLWKHLQAFKDEPNGIRLPNRSSIIITHAYRTPDDHKLFRQACWGVHNPVGDERWL